MRMLHAVIAGVVGSVIGAGATVAVLAAANPMWSAPSASRWQIHSANGNSYLFDTAGDGAVWLIASDSFLYLGMPQRVPARVPFAFKELWDEKAEKWRGP